MGSPDWSRIPFDKMPEWKREEILSRSKKVVETLEKPVEFKCEVCGKVAKNRLGLESHKRSHK